MNFKTNRIRDEFKELEAKNPKLANLLRGADLWFHVQFNKEITITHLYRTEEEHDALYAESDTKPARSPHQDWNAADIRSLDMSQKEKNSLLDFILKNYKNKDAKKTAFIHAIAGGAEHFHVYGGSL